MSQIHIHKTRPVDLAAALRKLADDIEQGKGGAKNLGIVVHTEPVPHPECPGMIGDIRYLGETAIISTREMPSDLNAAVWRFFNDLPVRGVSPVAKAVQAKAAEMGLGMSLELAAKMAACTEVVDYRAAVERFGKPPSLGVPAEVLEAAEPTGRSAAELQAEFFRKSIMAE